MLLINKNKKIFSKVRFASLFLCILCFATNSFAQEITAIDFNGDILGKIIPDGKVISTENEILGNVNADSFVVDKDGALIGGVVPQGIAIGNDNTVLGRINADGSVRLPSGKVVGKALPTGLIVDETYNLIGEVLFPGLVYSDAGKAVGRLTGDGSYTNIDGKSVGFISSGGYAYKKDGDSYIIDGRLLSSKMVISSEGKFIGSVALGGKVTDFDSNVIGYIHANGYAYNEEDKIIGHIVKNGYAISDDGEYLGFVSYNGEVIKNNQVIGYLRFDDNIVDKEQNIIGFFVDIAASFTDFSGNYIGRIMPKGKVVKGKDEIGSVFAKGFVVDNDGNLIGKMVNPGPVFDYRGSLIAHAYKNGQVTSLTGSSVGKIIDNNVFSNVGKVIGATFKNAIIIDKNNKSLGMNGVSGNISYGDRYTITPFGYVYGSDGEISAESMNLGAIYDIYGAVLGYITPNATIVNKNYDKIAEILQFGYAKNDNNKIAGKNIVVDFGINKAGDFFGWLSESNLFLNKAKNVIAKVLPDMSIVASGKKIEKVLSPRDGSAYKKQMVINKEGNLIGYVNDKAEVQDLEYGIIGKITENGYALDETGALIGEIVDLGTVIDDKCNFVGVITPTGDVRNYKDSVIGRILQNGQVVSQGGSVVGHRVFNNILIDRNNEFFATPAVSGYAFDGKNKKIGCIDINGYYKNKDNEILAGVLEYAHVMGYTDKIIGRVTFDGNVVDEDGNVIGKVTLNGNVVSEDNKALGHIFKYRYAFDNNNEYLGRVLDNAKVVNNHNEDLGFVSYEGYVIDNGEKIGYASYDMYIYDNDSKAIGYIDKNGEVKDFSNNKLGDLDKGFVLNRNDKLIGRIKRDYWVVNNEKEVLGELAINGKLYSLDGKVIGTLTQDGKIKDSKDKIIATPYPLQYYMGKVKKKPVKEDKEIKVQTIDDDKTNEDDTEKPVVSEQNKADIEDFSSKIIGIALTPDGDYLGDIIENGDVVDKKGNLIGKRMPDGLIIDDDGNLIGIEEIKKPASQDIFVPAGTFGDGGAYGIGNGVNNLGPGGGYGPGERYSQARALGLQEAQNLRRQSMSVGKISTNINKSSFDGYQKDWGDVAPKELSTWRVDMSNMIFADKPIPAVLARSIDSSHPSPVVAYVERNIYAEEGRNIIIPAGSRVMGELAGAGEDSGEANSYATKVDITWSRLIRPDGSMFKLEGKTADAQGRGGALGYLDKQLINKYAGPVATSLVTSAIDVLLATNDNSDGETETSKQQAMSDARDNFNDAMKRVTNQMFEDAMSIKPLTYVPAGTRIIIYPMVDLWVRTAEDDAEGGSESLKKPTVFIDDAQKSKERKDDQKRVNSQVVYSENMSDNVEQQGGGMKLINDNSSQNNTNKPAAGTVPPVTVSPIGTPPPPPASYSSEKTGKSNNTNSSSSVPQLF